MPDEGCAGGKSLGGFGVRRDPFGGFWSLVALCAAALAVRVAVARWLPSIIHQDEVFQYLEQGHRLAFGNGFVPWEYLVGSRLWLLPGFIGGVMWLCRLFSESPEFGLAIVAITMSLLSLVPVVCGFLWGRNVGGFLGAIAVGTLNAFWFEMVYFAPHALSETLAADFLVAGLYVAYPGGRPISRKSLFWGNVLLGFALVTRFQLAPAIGVGVIAICGREVRSRYPAAVLGLAVPILLSGLLDSFTWDWPFQSMVMNVWVNLIEGVASAHSVAPFYQYLAFLVTYWSGAFVLIVILALCGARKLPVLLLVVATAFASHTVLIHKEYRFIYPVLPLILTLAGIGSAEVVERVRAGLRTPILRSALVVGLPLFWVTTSAILARGREFYPLWYRDAGSIEAVRSIDADPAACGVALYPETVWDRSGGYAHLRRGLSLFGWADGVPQERTMAFNYMISYKAADFSGLGFQNEGCWQEPPGRTQIVGPICLWRRPGTCSPDAAPLLTAIPPTFLTRNHPDWFRRKEPK